MNVIMCICGCCEHDLYPTSGVDLLFWAILAVIAIAVVVALCFFMEHRCKIRKLEMEHDHELKKMDRQFEQKQNLSELNKMLTELNQKISELQKQIEQIRKESNQNSINS